MAVVVVVVMENGHSGHGNDHNGPIGHNGQIGDEGHNGPCGHENGHNG